MMRQKNKMNIFDISIPLDEKTLIYPGNAGFSVRQTRAWAPGQNSLSEIVMGSHTGTHIDAPSHSVEGGATLDQLPLDRFVGPCRVVDFTHIEFGKGITRDDCIGAGIKPGERILAKTKNSERGFHEMHDDFIYLSPDAADYLGDLKIALFGIDFLSIKKRGDSDNRPHTSLLSKNIPIVEGLDLSRVSAGDYFLVCLSPKLIGIEGSPARAILLSLPLI
jgi:arylformamidase